MQGEVGLGGFGCCGRKGVWGGWFGLPWAQWVHAGVLGCHTFGLGGLGCCGFGAVGLGCRGCARGCPAYWGLWQGAGPGVLGLPSTPRDARPPTPAGTVP